MRIAKIVVAAAVYAIDKPYDYLVPEELDEKIRPGMRVTVPFGKGNRRSEGLVLRLEEQSERSSLKLVESLLDDEPVMDETMLYLAAFLRERYFCTFFEAARAMLPAGLWFHARGKVVLTALGQSADLEEKLKRHRRPSRWPDCCGTLAGRRRKPSSSVRSPPRRWKRA